jgi:hypothetical protein
MAQDWRATGNVEEVYLHADDSVAAATAGNYLLYRLKSAHGA